MSNDDDASSSSASSLSSNNIIASPVQCWPDNVVVQVTPELIADAHVLWNTYGGEKATAQSVWIQAHDPPRCLVEALALQIADFHLQGTPYAGVEIWVQYRSSSSSSSSSSFANQHGLEFHFDKDEQAAKQNIWKHPVVGTATYLTTGGAPLVVFATASQETVEEEVDDDKNNDEANKKDKGEASREETNGDSSDRHVPKKAKLEEEEDDEDQDNVKSQITRTAADDNDQTSSASSVADATEESEHNPDYAWICYPQKGRHVAFAGNLLHGVVPELVFDAAAADDDAATASTVDRLSLLVNIWLDHKPAGLQCISDKVLQQLHKHDDTTMTSTTATLETPIQALEPIELIAMENEPLTPLQEHNPGDTAPLPFQTLQKLVKESTTTTPFVQVSYNNSIATSSPVQEEPAESTVSNTNEAWKVLDQYLNDDSHNWQKPVRQSCPKCGASRSLYCYDCCCLVGEEDQLTSLPQGRIRMPCAVDMILDDRRAVATGIHALIMLERNHKDEDNYDGNDNTRKYRLFDQVKGDGIPDYTMSTGEGTFLLFPSETSMSLSTVAAQVRRLVLVDCKWTKSHICQDARLANLPCVHLDHPPAESYFWRWHNAGAGRLCTLEALYLAAWQVAVHQGWTHTECHALVNLFWVFRQQRAVIIHKYQNGQGHKTIPHLPFSQDAKACARKLREKQNPKTAS
jgi:hypothetical protein